MWTSLMELRIYQEDSGFTPNSVTPADSWMSQVNADIKIIISDSLIHVYVLTAR